MNREELRRYIMEEYHAENDFPWLRDPENEQLEFDTDPAPPDPSPLLRPEKE